MIMLTRSSEINFNQMHYAGIIIILHTCFVRAPFTLKMFAHVGKTKTFASFERLICSYLSIARCCATDKDFGLQTSGFISVWLPRIRMLQPACKYNLFLKSLVWTTACSNRNYESKLWAVCRYADPPPQFWSGFYWWWECDV